MYHDHHGHLHLTDKKTPTLDKRIFDTATKWLHKNKSFDAENLADGAPLALVNEINRVLKSAVKSGLSNGIKHEVPKALTQALDRNVFVFSGLKVYHELKEASLLLKDENGGIKPYNTFRQEMTAIHQAYNVNHLEAEYNFATQTAQMAAKWNDFERDGDEYDLQYRTAADEKVRASHYALHNTTLPPSDPFWNENMPPLDWNCRCTVVQVLKDKYPQSNSAEAVAQGRKATTRLGKDGVNRAAMFRFNPGKQRVIFPEKHPYYKVQQRVREIVEALGIAGKEKIEAASNLVSWYKQSLPKTKVAKFGAKRFEIMRPDLKEPVVINANFYNEIISKYKSDKNYVLKLEIAKNAHELIGAAEFTHREDAIHGKGKFNVYSIIYENTKVIMKVRVTEDGNFLHYLRI